MVQNAETVWRDFATDGIPASGPWEPRKPEIRELITSLELGVLGASAGSAIFTTKATMDANLAYPQHTMAWVISDATTANNGIYRKIGASGSGSWERRGDLPHGFIRASNTGAGTENAIQATTSLPIPTADGAALIALPIVADNTASPVTVSFNGGSALTIKTNSGNDVPAGGLVAGMIVAGYVSGATFRLLSDQASAAIVAAAEAAAIRAEEAAILAGGGHIFPESLPSWNPADASQAIEDASAISASSGGVVKLTAGHTYLCTEINIASGAKISAVGAVLRLEGAVTADAAVTFGNDCRLDEVVFSFDGSQIGADLIHAGDNFEAGIIHMIADTQIGYNTSSNGIIATGVGTKIRELHTENIDYPLTLRNQSATTLGTDNDIGNIYCRNYLRPFYAIFCSGRRGDIYAVGRSPNADAIGALDGGRYISILYEGCSDFESGDVYMEDCGHGTRVGGSPNANAQSKNLKFGNYYLVRPRGCAFKVNPTRLASAGVTEKAENIEWGDIYVIDGGDGTAEGNRDILRLTHVRNGKGGRIGAFIEQKTFSGQTGILLNDIDGLTIAGAHFENVNGGGVWIDGSSDTDGVSTFRGPVKNVFIGPISGAMVGSNAVAVSGPVDYENIHVAFAGFGGFTRLFAAFGTPTFAGFLRLHGYVNSAAEPAILAAPTSADATVDVAWKSRRFSGRLSSARWKAQNEASGDTIDLAVTPADGKYGVLSAFAHLATAGDGVYGGSVALGRPGSSRRGAALVSKQRGAAVANVGAVVLTTGTATADSDQLAEHTEFWPNGDMELMQTARGIIIKSPDGTRYKITIANGGTINVAPA